MSLLEYTVELRQLTCNKALDAIEYSRQLSTLPTTYSAAFYFQ